MDGFHGASFGLLSSYLLLIAKIHGYVGTTMKEASW